MNIVKALQSVHWQPGIGDPTLIGWLTVVAYLVAAGLCLLCAQRAEQIFPHQPPLRHRLIWGGLAIAMLLLGINKQLDLQSAFTDFVKALAYLQGWYTWGQRAQVLFILLLGAFSLGCVLLLGWSIRQVWQQYWVLLFGLLALARFIVVRAATFYGVALPELSHFTGGLRVNWLLELVGALLIIVAAGLNLRQRRVQPVRSWYQLTEQ
ncbi:MAG: hypothetical protein R3C14_34645 [Caldilineaceae bacterium]